MKSERDLISTLRRIDGRGYKAYKDIEGAFRFERFTLFIDHAQSDPFAPPSKVRVRVSQDIARFPNELFKNRTRRIALTDFIARRVKEVLQEARGKVRGTGKSGIIQIDAGGQEVLERTAVIINENWVEARLWVGLPAIGRKILGDEAVRMFTKLIPFIVEKSLMWSRIPQERAKYFVECIENQEFIRDRLESMGLVAFVGDGSILPRRSGASDLPMPKERAIPFKSPPSMRVIFELPNPVRFGGITTRRISGMGIPKGVTLIVGGGYHGKSTLLKAIERGIYPHIPGDGREYVVSIKDTVKIRAEDGRRVEKVDISPFIENLPYGLDTRSFSTDDASGSTSQAANIVEYLEVGAKVLLLDEDTSATNFMIRDARMQALVSKENEPITPFLDRVRELYERWGVSTILVMGGSGDYFDVADKVIMMKDFEPYDVTEEAKRIAKEYRTERKIEVRGPFNKVRERIPIRESLNPKKGSGKINIKPKSVDILLFGKETLDLRHVEQLVDVSQTRAVGYSILLSQMKFMDGKKSLREILELLEKYLDEVGLDYLDPTRRGEKHPGNFARPRRFEIAAAINRLRSLQVKQR